MLAKLIRDGRFLKRKLILAEDNGFRVTEEYIQWVTRATLYMEEHYPGSANTRNFARWTRRVLCGKPKYHDHLLGILVGVKDYLDEKHTADSPQESNNVTPLPKRPR
ncbi:MAG: hypothetical protein ACM3QZ_00890 [Solirubrobacterales bacterium]